VGCDNSQTLQAYAAGAAGYDERTDRFVVFRRRIVDALDVRRGDVVVDVGCGTGLCLPLLQERVGAEGVIIAVDESVAMLGIARPRRAVRLVECDLHLGTGYVATGRVPD
jgi:demethylmenaquinone methyltransferase/2-methoxy-6-polyprenyl-1,4-benzoquinol methylase